MQDKTVLWNIKKHNLWETKQINTDPNWFSLTSFFVLNLFYDVEKKIAVSNNCKMFIWFLIDMLFKVEINSSFTSGSTAGTLWPRLNEWSHPGKPVWLRKIWHSVYC